MMCSTRRFAKSDERLLDTLWIEASNIMKQMENPAKCEQMSGWSFEPL